MASDSRRATGGNGARLLALSLTLVCFLSYAQPACAVLITASGILQFYDDFEGISPGNNPDNGVKPGHWVITGTQPTSDSTTPGPAEGKQYLSCPRVGAGGPGFENQARAHLATEQGFYGVKIHAEWMMYVPSATPATYRANIHFMDNSENSRAGLLLGEGMTGRVEYCRPDGKWQAASLTYKPDIWQKWTMEYTVGESQFTLSIGNGPTETLDAHTAGGVAVMSFVGNHDVGSTFYLDAVPREPSTTGLLITGQDLGKSAMPGASATKK